MQYLAILGRQAELSLAELEAVLGSEQIKPFGPETARLARPVQLSRLGGTIKLARVIPNLDPANLPAPGSSQTNLGLSWYGGPMTARRLTAMGLKLKQVLAQRGGSWRFVAPRSGTSLTAAQVKFNQLLGPGFELTCATHQGQTIYGLTESVQDIDWYSRRDYGRPVRAAGIGMLPPKLAQILLNLSGDGPIHDPFCGTGVILQEALLMGRPANGSDIAPGMVAASRTNLEWLARQVDHTLPKWSVELADARRVHLTSPGTAIVTEGYLGPNLTQPIALAEFQRLDAELSALYRRTLAHLATQLARGASVVICVPVWPSRA